MSAEFIRAIRDAGIPIDADIVADSRLHRLHVNGDKAGTQNAWYVCFGSAGAFGCHKRAISGKWRANQKRRPLTQCDYTQIEADHKAHAAAHEQSYIDAAERAAQTLQKATRDASRHPYIVRKGIQPHGVKANDHGLLCVPIHSARTGMLQTLQFIAGDGGKKMLTGGRMKDGCFPFQDTADFWNTAHHRIGIGEGWATCATLAESLPSVALFAAFSATNLMSVARALRDRYSDASIVLYGDHDTNGVGQRYASAAATAIDGLVAIPPKLGDDWNDFATRTAA